MNRPRERGQFLSLSLLVLIAVGSLVQRFPDLALATDTPAWNGRLVLRGLDELPVSLG